jgi:hypothetical protein
MVRRKDLRPPAQSGWVLVYDMHRTLVWNSGRIGSGAQDVLQRKFSELEAKGWQLEGRVFDMQFASRDNERLLIALYPSDPMAPPQKGLTTPGPVRAGWK